MWVHMGYSSFHNGLDGGFLTKKHAGIAHESQSCAVISFCQQGPGTDVSV